MFNKIGNQKVQNQYHGFGATAFHYGPNFNFYEDVLARFLEARILDYKVICIYVPNGNPLNTDKYYYKIHWLNEFY